MSRIGLYIRYSPWGDVTPQTMRDKGMGGRETALVQLAQSWAAMGHEVFAFVPLEGKGGTQDYPDGGRVAWLPNTSTLTIVPALALDLFVSWEDIPIVDEVRPFVRRTVVEMQVAHLPDMLDLSNVDNVAVLSEFAWGVILRQYPISDKLVVLPNGVDKRLYDSMPTVEGLPFKTGAEFLYSSSPDRGLHHLLAMWPKLNEAFDGSATLHICYGVDDFIADNIYSHREAGGRALVIERALADPPPSIMYHGKVGQDVLAGMHRRVDVLTYPADTMSATETGCVSIVEALAAGSKVVTTTCDCIPSEFGHLSAVTCVPLPLDYTDYVNQVVLAVNDKKNGEKVGEVDEFVQSRDWMSIARRWDSAFDLSHLAVH